jgi:hypothetical protein
MAVKPVSAEDFINIFNLLGVYQSLVDEGDEEGWTGLFTEDGLFTGLWEPFRGREGLKTITDGTRAYNGKMRHLTGSLSIQYGATKDEAFARYYSLVTTWVKSEGPQFFMMAVCNVHLLRLNGEWKIKSNTIQNLNE